jgi:hypothetical protein
MSRRAAFAIVLMVGAAAAADAETVTFDWVSTSGPAATGSVSITSALITSPTGFSLTATGAAAVAEISAFNITFSDGESMALTNSTFTNSTGWSDDSTGHLTSTWNASRSVTNPAGTLQVSSVPYAGTSTAQTVLTSGITQDFGFWQIQTTPVPLPAAVWLLGSGLAGLIATGRRRSSATAGTV